MKRCRRRLKSSRWQWHSFPEGVYSIGFEGSGFAFDNEGPRHNVYLEPFRLASRLVTNGEYLEFMRDGGYSKPTLWLSDGWDTVRTTHGKRPCIGSSATANGGTTPWTACSRCDRTSRSATSASTRPTRLPAGRALGLPQRIRMGDRGAARAASKVILLEIRTRCIRSQQRRREPLARCSAMSGSGPSAPIVPYPGFQAGRGRGRRVQRQVHVQPDGACAAARARLRSRTFGPAIATSSRPMCAGSSWDFGWPMATSKQLQFSTIRRYRPRCARGAYRLAQTSSGEAFLRRGRLAAVRADHRIAGVLPDAHRALDPGELRWRHPASRLVRR